MKRISITAAILMGSAAMVSSGAFADPTGGTVPVAGPTSDIGVSLQVLDECTIATHDIDFGTTGLIPNNIDTSTTVDIECTDGTLYAIGLDEGANAVSGVRKLKSGLNLVTYDLSSASDYSSSWGNTATHTVTGTGTASPIQVPLYARVAQHQNVPIGTYTDTVTATIWYGSGVTGH
jgi:spore coat protein U-like protein